MDSAAAALILSVHGLDARPLRRLTQCVQAQGVAQPRAATAVNQARVDAGRKVYFEGNIANGLPACVSCHRPNGSGIAPDFPRLACQQPAYVASQLKGWVENRGGPARPS